MYVNIYDSKIVLHIQFKHTKHRDIKYQSRTMLLTRWF